MCILHELHRQPNPLVQSAPVRLRGPFVLADRARASAAPTVEGSAFTHQAPTETTCERQGRSSNCSAPAMRRKVLGIYGTIRTASLPLID